MENLKINKRFTKRKEWWEAQLIIRWKNEDIDQATEECEKVYNEMKRNSPKCMKKAMEDVIEE